MKKLLVVRCLGDETALSPVAAYNSAVTLSQSRVFWATMNDCVFATYIRELYAREIECL
jgi:hypothetical protein